ncbi:MAG: helix-turn-helix transcriptional regulator, partial [Candidatus Micrarchaeota archaeon]|nr:helix-turn-helix transcriptional regulator [Candidatus Micrarchaeota archaeon]
MQFMTKRSADAELKETVRVYLIHDANNIGQAVRLLREDFPMTQVRLAALVGVTSSTISRIERGHEPGSKTLLRKIADQLDAMEAQREKLIELHGAFIPTKPSMD